MHARKCGVYLKKKKICEYHNLYAKSDTLLVADVFENFRNMCLKIYGVGRVYLCLHQDQHDKLV